MRLTLCEATCAPMRCGPSRSSALPARTRARAVRSLSGRGRPRLRQPSTSAVGRLRGRASSLGARRSPGGRDRRRRARRAGLWRTLCSCSPPLGRRRLTLGLRLELGVQRPSPLERDNGAPTAPRASDRQTDDAEALAGRAPRAGGHPVGDETNEGDAIRSSGATGVADRRASARGSRTGC